MSNGPLKQHEKLLPQRLALLESLLKKKGIAVSPLQTIPRRAESDTPPALSFAQQRLWFLDQLEPGKSTFTMATAMRMQGTLNVAILDRCLQEIVRRHESFRTTFSVVDGLAVQIIAPSQILPLPVVQIEHLQSSTQAQEIDRLVNEDAQLPFNLSQGPLLRALLLRVNAQEHILLLTMHHIISDGWSMSIVMRELTMLYNAFSHGKPSPLADLPIQYADFSVWQQHWLQGELLTSQLNYWKQQLEGVLPLDLPTDRPRPAVQTSHGAHFIVLLPVDLSVRLRAFSHSEGITLFMVLFAAFQTLLFRYTAQEDILAGTIIANRNRPEIEGLIGFFANTLALRTDFSGNPTVREILQRVRSVTLNAYAHQDLPFEKLGEVLQTERDLSRLTLFQCMLILHNVPRESGELAGLQLTLLETENAAAALDLVLSVMDDGEALRCVIRYSTDLFDQTTIARIAGHWQVLLGAFVDDPSQHIAELPLLTLPERRQILLEWNATDTDGTPELPLVQSIFNDQARHMPDAIAITYEQQHLTYDALNCKANQVAHRLQRLGVGPDTLVCICMERSIEMIIALLGILKAGGAYVPLDATYPADRLTFMIEDTQAPVLLTQKHLAKSFLPARSTVLCLDTDLELMASESTSTPVSTVHADNLAYVIYTSGSTGQPKGVALSHRSLVNLIEWEYAQLNLSEPARTLQFSSPGFDILFNEAFSTWRSGGTLVLISEMLQRDSETLLHFLVSGSIQRAFLPFAALQQLAEAFRIHQYLPDKLHAVLSTAEQLQINQSIVNFFKQLKHCFLHNEYGPSESHVVTATTLTDVPDNWPLLPPIGRPISNTHMYILSRDFNLVPIGIPGELYIGGVSLARGYFGRSDLTAEKFIPHPFSQHGGERLYRTGDLARYLPDGNIQYLGRLDHQVKLRGFRVELGEIETVLEQHTLVQDCVVVARESGPGDTRLVAYIIATHPSQQPSVKELRDYLRGRLPEYMLPTAFVFLDALPLTPNGKVNRRALPAPEVFVLASDETYVPPRTPTEEVLVGIWKKLLAIPQLGIDDNFFSSGGHSLLATRAISLMRTALNVELPLRYLFEAPTVKELAERIEQVRRSKHCIEVSPIVRVAREQDLPLSFAQQRLWFLDQLEPGVPFYNMPVAVRMKGDLNVKALMQSIQQVIQRHESLRTTFVAKAGKPVQVIYDGCQIVIPVVSLLHLSADDAEREALHLRDEAALLSFNLSSGPLLRGFLLHINAHEYVLLVTMHHIISDAWSMGVFTQEIVMLYDVYISAKPSPLLPLPIQYADFAVWQRGWLQREVLDDHVAYWRKQLRGASALQLPTDQPRPAVQSYRGASQTFAFSQELSQALQTLSRREDVTLFMTLFAAFAVLLWRWTGQKDIVVGTDIANRTRQETEGLIGFFVNLLVLRVDLGGPPTFLELLQRVRTMLLEAYTYQDIPFDMLVDGLRLERKMNHTPLVQVLFVLQNVPRPAQEVPGLSVTPFSREVTTAKFDLALFLNESEQGLQGSVNYSTDLFTAPTIARFLRQFETLLEHLLAEPQKPVDLVEWLSPEEQEQQQRQKQARRAAGRQRLLGTRGQHSH